MDYRAFFGDVLAWIGQANQEAARHGMDNPNFWQWVADSAGALCLKYQNNRLAMNQMIMLVEWLEEAHLKQKGAQKHA